jgi:hypothetical protein
MTWGVWRVWSGAVADRGGGVSASRGGHRPERPLLEVPHHLPNDAREPARHRPSSHKVSDNPIIMRMLLETQPLSGGDNLGLQYNGYRRRHDAATYTGGAMIPSDLA